MRRLLAIIGLLAACEAVMAANPALTCGTVASCEGATSCEVTPPTVANDDLMVLLAGATDSSAFPADLEINESGWTQRGQIEDATGNDRELIVETKIAASESGTYTVRLADDSSTTFDAVICVIPDGDFNASSILDGTVVTDGANNVNSWNPTSHVTATDNALSVLFMLAGQANTGDNNCNSPPSGYTEEAELFDSSIARLFCVWENTVETAGTEDPGEITGISTSNAADPNGILFSISPAAAVPAFSSAVTLDDCTATQCTFDFTTDSTGTVFAAAYTPGASAPANCDAVETGTGAEDTASVAVVASVANSITLDVVFPSHDFYFCPENSLDVDGSVSSIVAQLRDAATGYQLVTNVGLSATSVFATPTDTTCDVTSGNTTISGCGDTSDFAVGMLATISSGFPTTDVYRITNKTSSSLTFDTAPTSSPSNVTVTGFLEPDGGAFFDPVISANDIFEVQTTSSIGGTVTWETDLDMKYVADSGEEQDFAEIKFCSQDESDSTGEFTSPACWTGSFASIYHNNVPPSFDIEAVASISLPVGSAMDSIDFNNLCSHSNLSPATELRVGSSLPASLTMSNGTVSGTVSVENEAGFSVDIWCGAGGLFDLQTWTAYPVDTWTMTNIVGLTQTAAETAIVSDAPWREGDGIQTSLACSDSVASGNIISQTPTAATEVAAEVAITAIISDGTKCATRRRGFQ